MSLSIIQCTQEDLELDAQLAGSSEFAPVTRGRMSHPDPNGLPDRRPIKLGDVRENPVTGEYGKVLELPWHNQQGRLVAELKALAGARVMGEHFHPAITEYFRPLEGELTVKCDEQTRVLREGETAVVEPGVWHDWWNATDRDIRVHLEVTPGDRFLHMIETFFGLARLGYTDSKGVPHPLQLALCAVRRQLFIPVDDNYFSLRTTTAGLTANDIYFFLR